jgi:hypothetical protein
MRARSRAHSTTGSRNGVSTPGSDDPFGYHVSEIQTDHDAADRMAVRRAVQEAMAARQQAVANQRRAADEFAETLALAHATFLDFRAVAGVLFVERRDRVALGLFNQLPVDARAFVKAARSIYRAALEEDRLARLAGYGYDAAALQTALDGLAAVLAARRELVNAMAHTHETLVGCFEPRRVA